MAENKVEQYTFLDGKKRQTNILPSPRKVTSPQTTTGTLSKPFKGSLVLGDDWKITSDPLNIILWQKQGKTWKTHGYYGVLGEALVEMVRQEVRTDLSDLKAVVARIDALEARILGLAKGIK